MSKFDWSDLDGRLLRLLVAVVETGSVTGAAQRLGVTQSAVSHLLDKLRDITADPLFVKSGRGIVATARAELLAAQARELIDQLERFARAGEFAPARWQTTFTIAANDFQRDVLLPPLVASLHAVDLALRHFPRVVGVKDGAILFDLPAGEVSEALLRELYAAEGGLPLAGAPSSEAGVIPASGTLPPLRCA